MLYATFLQVPLLDLATAWRDRRFTAAVVVGNFIVMPLVVWAMVPVLPDDPGVRLGVLLVLLVPCTDWVISFTQMAGGDVARAIAVTPVNLVLQLMLLPVYLMVMAREEVAGLVTVDVAASALGVVVLPLIAAVLTEKWLDARQRGHAIRERWAWAPVPLLATVMFLIATAQVHAVLGALAVLPLVAPVFVAFLVAAGLTAKALAMVFTLPVSQARTLAFGLGTRNSFLVLPIALSLPQGFDVAAIVVVMQSLVELLGMIVFVWLVPIAFARSSNDAPR
nr:bile acid:sodium symporter [Dietzia sp. DQ11-38-2]